FLDRNTVINNCVESNIFSHSKLIASENINILLGSVNLNKNTLKGGEYITSILKLINENHYLYNKCTILFFGISNKNEFQKMLNIKYKNIKSELNGYISCKHEMAKLYAKSDIFLHCSLIENLSTVLIESELSGCHSIAFNVGGNNEIIKNQDYLIPPYSEFILKYKLANLVARLYDSTIDSRLITRNNIRKLAIQRFNDDNSIKKHIRFYNQKNI
ncbi:glycosyltransferase, partial [Providencia sp. Me1]|uniref:glycosyltransferase n=1 Tax=Providencia sp. Me1 TaxID=3392634 RepID=UPI003D29E673